MSQMTSGLARGVGQNPQNVEREHDASYPNGGLITDIPMGINDWTLTTGAQLAATTAANAPFRAAVQGNLLGIRWDATVTTGSIRTTIKLPGEYDANQDECVFIGTFRYSGSGSDGNVNMLARADYFQPGHVVASIADPTAAVAAGNIVASEATIQAIDPTVTTGVNLGQNQWSVAPSATAPTNALVSRRLAGFAAASNASGFLDYAFNFSFNTPAKLAPGSNSINLFKPLSIVTLTLSNSASAGTNNNIDFVGGILRIRRNLSINPRASRFARGTIR